MHNLDFNNCFLIIYINVLIIGENAVKYTDNGIVKIIFEGLPSEFSNIIEIKLSVKDTGIGIEEE